MNNSDTPYDRLLDHVRSQALHYLQHLPERPVRAEATADELRGALGGALPEEPTDALEVLRTLTALADRGTTATTSGRFFGFVIGGAVPAAMAADMLTPVWDQNAGMYTVGPLPAVAEEIAREWLVELFGLPAEASLGVVTGGQMANTTGLAVARHHVLAAAGWDVERDGLAGGPRITVVVGAERHSTIDGGLRFLGLGADPIVVDVDDAGAMRAEALTAALREIDGPAIVCAQLGNVNTGALDPVGQLADIAHEHGAWLHVDGAFGLWARATPRLRERTIGTERADSWAVDGHKWLNVPYDAGLVFTAHPASHRAATGTDRSLATYLQFGDEVRDAMEWTPEASRRARGVAIWAAIRSLGRSGIVEMIDRNCAMARRFAEQLDAAPGVSVHNEVVLNQVLVGFAGADGADVVAAVQDEGTCWPSHTTWRGRSLMRISVSNWQTDTDDVDRSVAAILRCHDKVRTA